MPTIRRRNREDARLLRREQGREKGPERGRDQENEKKNHLGSSRERYEAESGLAHEGDAVGRWCWHEGPCRKAGRECLRIRQIPRIREARHRFRRTYGQVHPSTARPGHGRRKARAGGHPGGHLVGLLVGGELLGAIFVPGRSKRRQGYVGRNQIGLWRRMNWNISVQGLVWNTLQAPFRQEQDPTACVGRRDGFDASYAALGWNSTCCGSVSVSKQAHSKQWTPAGKARRCTNDPLVLQHFFPWNQTTRAIVMPPHCPDRHQAFLHTILLRIDWTSSVALLSSLFSFPPVSSTRRHLPECILRFRTRQVCSRSRAGPTGRPEARCACVAKHSRVRTLLCTLRRVELGAPNARTSSKGVRSRWWSRRSCSFV